MLLDPPPHATAHAGTLSRRRFLQAGVVTAGAAAVLRCGPRAVRERPNIVWIIADDLSPDLGCYDNRLVRTPNLDRLASQGCRYTNAFVTAPVCSPSRSALITGMYQTSIGAHHHRSHREDGYTPPPPVRLITDYFREAGYYTVNDKGTGLGTTGKTDFNFHAEQPFDGADCRQRPAGLPFYAHVNIAQPHRARPPDVWSPTKVLSEHVDPARVTLPPYYPDHPIAREDWAGYLDCIAVLDEKVGRVLDRLDEDGLKENTVVIFFGDHGRPMPRAKQFLYDAGIRVPLIIRWPGNLEPGTTNDDLVSAIDLSATSLSLAGIEPPPHLEGQVMLGPNVRQRDFIFAARDRCDETMDRIRCVRDERFKYIRNFEPERPYMQTNRYKEASYPIWRLLKRLHAKGKLSREQSLFLSEARPREELYDTQADPDEARNLAGDPSHQAILERMCATLDKWIKTTGDQGETPEDPAIAAYWEEQMKERYAPVLADVYERDRQRGPD